MKRARTSDPASNFEAFLTVQYQSSYIEWPPSISKAVCSQRIKPPQHLSLARAVQRICTLARFRVDCVGCMIRVILVSTFIVTDHAPGNALSVSWFNKRLRLFRESYSMRDVLREMTRVAKSGSCARARRANTRAAIMSFILTNPGILNGYRVWDTCARALYTCNMRTLRVLELWCVVERKKWGRVEDQTGWWSNI